MVMGKRAAEASQSGGPGKHSEKSKAAGRSNLEAGRRKKEEMRKAAGDRETAGERWARLLSGTLTVQELEDREIEHMTVLAKDGTLARRRKMPSHMVDEFRKELLRRTKADIDKHGLKAAQALGKILDDPEAKYTDVLKAAGMILDRIMGKAPETVRVEQGSKWDALMDAAVLDDRSDIDDELEKMANGDD